MAKDDDLAEAWRKLVDAMQADRERHERLVAAIEANTNASNRLAQQLEKREADKRVKAVKTHRTPVRKVAVTPRAEAIAKAALARHKGKA